jgi:hypothetical protein
MAELTEHYIIKITSTTNTELGFHGFYFAANEQGKERQICRYKGTTPFKLNAIREMFGSTIMLNPDEKDIPLKLEIIRKIDNLVIVSGIGLLLLSAFYF